MTQVGQLPWINFIHTIHSMKTFSLSGASINSVNCVERVQGLASLSWWSWWQNQSRRQAAQLIGTQENSSTTKQDARLAENPGKSPHSVYPRFFIRSGILRKNQVESTHTNGSETTHSFMAVIHHCFYLLWEKMHLPLTFVSDKSKWWAELHSLAKEPKEHWKLKIRRDGAVSP